MLRLPWKSAARSADANEPRFLAPLLRKAPSSCALRHVRSDRILATRVFGAFESAVRRRGLRDHPAFAAGDALIIAPCEAVHTAFMPWPIDVLFVTRTGEVVKVCRRVPPWRAVGAWGAFAAIELPAGTLETEARGDRLVLDCSAP